MFILRLIILIIIIYQINHSYYNKITPNLIQKATLLRKTGDKESLFLSLLAKFSSTEMATESLFFAKEESKRTIIQYVSSQVSFLEGGNTFFPQDALMHDEFLRGQLWNLAESLKLIEHLYPERSGELASVYIKAHHLLDKGLKDYQQIKNLLATKLTHKKNDWHEHEEAGLIGFAADDELVPLYAQEFEKLTGLTHWNSDKAKCGGTARAILYYFFKHESIEGDLKKLVRHPQMGVVNLLQELKKNRFNEKKGFLYFCESGRLDHVFVIQQTSSGKYRLLQSFVNQYTLKANLATQGFMDFDQLIEKIELMQKVAESEEWNIEVERNYEHLFLSKPWKFVIDEFKDYQPDFNFIAVPYLEQHDIKEANLSQS